MNCFVTGGADFIGSHIVDKLISDRNEVTIYDNFSTGREIFLEEHKHKSNPRIVTGDILDLELLITYL